MTIEGDEMRVRFDRWDQAAYGLFLATKHLPEHEIRYYPEADAYEVVAPSRFAGILGIERPAPERDLLPFPEFLFDRQRYFARLALAAKRYACWWDTGLGKTLLGLEWTRQVRHRTGGKVLLIVPLNLIPEWLAVVAERYGEEIPIRRLDSREALRAWCATGPPGVSITNPEKLIPREEGASEIIGELTYCAGVVLDEASLLKTGGGKIKWALIKSCRGIPYKLSLTATPAPNDPIEYASQASFLEKIRDEGEVIWTFFARDKEGEWRVKAHALEAFYRFLSGWSCYVRNPALYGFRDGLANLPDPERIEHEVAPTTEQLDARGQVADQTGQTSLLEPKRVGIVERGRYAQLAAGFLYEEGRPARRVASGKPALAARILHEEAAGGRQVLVWTLYDESVSILFEELQGLGAHRVAALTGKVPRDRRPPLVEAYRTGEIQVLITRPEVLGFGFNLQNTGAMLFYDLNDSYEQSYQAERRAVRYGQTRAVRIHYLRVAGLEDAVWQNLQAKKAQFEGDIARMERLFLEAMRELP